MQTEIQVTDSDGVWMRLPSGVSLMFGCTRSHRGRRAIGWFALAPYPPDGDRSKLRNMIASGTVELGAVHIRQGVLALGDLAAVTEQLNARTELPSWLLDAWTEPAVLR
jgi:hypothetical protein